MIKEVAGVPQDIADGVEAELLHTHTYNWIYSPGTIESWHVMPEFKDSIGGYPVCDRFKFTIPLLYFKTGLVMSGPYEGMTFQQATSDPENPAVKSYPSIIKLVNRAFKYFPSDNYIVTRVMCNISTPGPANTLNAIHNDGRHGISFLYYVNQSDGDTLFFSKGGELLKRVTPKKGNGVVFDSSTLHAGMSPNTAQLRAVVNITFERAT